MTEDRLPLAELLAKAGDGDFLRSIAEAVVQLLMETDVEGLIGAGRHERSGERTTYQNGYRHRTLDTRLGSLQLVGSDAPNPEASAGQPRSAPRLKSLLSSSPARHRRRRWTTGTVSGSGPILDRAA